MTEFLKGYAAGANDMEAGRLVKKEPPTLDRIEAIAEAMWVALNTHRYRAIIDGKDCRIIPWADAGVAAQDDYRRMARAAVEVDSLALTELELRDTLYALEEGAPGYVDEPVLAKLRALLPEEPTTKGDT